VQRLFVNPSQFAVEAVFGLVDLKAIFEHEFCFLSGREQFGVPIGGDGSQHSTRQPPQAIFQFRDALDDFRRGDLRFDVAIEGDFAFDFLDVFADGNFAIVNGVDDLREDTSKFILVGHGHSIRATYNIGGGSFVCTSGLGR
jgi:hypothetical protein